MGYLNFIKDTEVVTFHVKSHEEWDEERNEMVVVHDEWGTRIIMDRVGTAEKNTVGQCSSCRKWGSFIGTDPNEVCINCRDRRKYSEKKGGGAFARLLPHETNMSHTCEICGIVSIKAICNH